MYRHEPGLYIGLVKFIVCWIFRLIGICGSGAFNPSNKLRSRIPRRPGPLEVEAAQVAADVQHFTDKIQPR